VSRIVPPLGLPPLARRLIDFIEFFCGRRGPMPRASSCAMKSLIRLVLWRQKGLTYWNPL
jgi:hypothetical protein